MKKFKKDLPDEFLKRWLLETNKEKFTEEQIEKDFDHFKEDLKCAQYYGMMDIPDDQLTNYAKKMLEKGEDRRRFSERKFEDKISEFVRNTVKIDQKEISLEKFNKMLEK